MSTSSTKPVSAEVTGLVIGLLAERGYDSVTADDLADVTGMSRSTFFRRFGNKDDVVFADHERLLQQLTEFLEQTTLDTVPAVTAAARIVLDHHLQQPELSRLRYRLIHEHAQLLDRELLLIPRYERAFAEYLARAASPLAPAWAAPAFAAGIVAVHNVVLRQWLRDTSVAAGNMLEAEISALAGVFAPVLNADSPAASRVVVASFSSGASPEEVLRRVAEQLG